MIRTPRSSNDGMSKGAWTAAEDQILRDYIKLRGEGKWSNVAKETGLKRCGKSCRLRWMNYLRPGIKRGNISRDEEELIIRLHKLLGNRWSLIAGRLPGRTDNEIKNYWNSNLAKKLPEPLVQSKNINKMRTRVKFQLPSSSLPPPAPPTPAAGNSVFIGAAAPSDEEDTKELINGVELPLCTEGHRARIDKTAIHETETGWHSSSDGSPSSMSTKEGDNDNSSDFMMLDFNVEDFCNILDCNVEDFTNKFSETEDEASIFPEKIMEENWGGDQSDTTTTTTADQDQFLSLASSFLESAEEWPGDHDFNNNINHVSKSFNLH